MITYDIYSIGFCQPVLVRSRSREYRYSKPGVRSVHDFVRTPTNLVSVYAQQQRHFRTNARAHTHAAAAVLPRRSLQFVSIPPCRL